MSLTPAELQRFRELVSDGLGMHFEDDKLDGLAEVFRERLQGREVAVYFERWHRLGGAAEELRAIAQALTVGESYFFRLREHFEALANKELPRLASGRPERRLRVLSAGCATGEEPYSLAILLTESLPELEAWSVDIVAVDINPTFLAGARRAQYGAWALRDTPEPVLSRWFEKHGREHVLDERLRRMVKFEERNLVADDPTFWQPNSFDVVFCRNVLIYLTQEAKVALMSRIAAAMAPGGPLFLGHAETLRGLSDDFHLKQAAGAFYYRRRSSEARLSAPAESTRVPWSLSAARPAVVPMDVSWVSAIGQASQRLVELEARSASVASPGGAAPVDLGPAMELLRRERFDEALGLIARMPAAIQDDADALLLRAVALTNSGQVGEAQRVCERLLALDELHAGAHYLMALCREHSGNLEGAAESDRFAVHLDPTFAMPHLHLALLARRRGDEETARQEAAAALGLLPREDPSRLLLFGGGLRREALVQIAAALQPEARHG